MTWLRNHSSYLNAGGFLGALEAIAVYTRGIIGNLLMLLPILLLLGGFLGYFHHSFVSNPLALSPWVLLVAVLLAFVYFGFRLGRPQEQIQTSRVLNWLASVILAVLVATLVLDLSPLVVELARKHPFVAQFGLKELFAL